DARVHEDALPRHACLDRPVHPLLQEGEHLAQEILVVGRHLHRLRSALHVHEATGGPGLRHHARQLRIEVETADVVDQHRPSREHLSRHRRLGGVHREGHGRAGPEP
ncbi:2-dehydro-3-deoxygalactonate kinase, partial [Stigmatella aurantiaca DW4/3-1]